MSKKTRHVEVESPRSDAPFWVAIAFALCFGALSFWRVFEYDVFFDVRWGREILETGRVQSVDSWSHTAFGKECFNFEWLSTVVVYFVSRMAQGYAALGWFRSALIALWVFFSARFVQRQVRSTSHQIAVLALLIPWIYVMSSFRLQMRPDLFASCHYVVLLALWHSQMSVVRKRAWSLPLLLSWSNFHAGTAPIGVFVVSALVAFIPAAESGENWIQKAKWILAAIATWFLTPVGFAPISVVTGVVLDYDHSLWGNPDFQPFSWELLRFDRGGWVFLLWLAFCLAVVWSYLYLRFEKRTWMPSLYQHRGVLPVIGGALFFQFFNKIRIIHYQVIFFLPLIAAALGAAIDSGAWKKRRVLTGLSAACAIFLWAIVLPHQIRFVARPLGSGLDDTELPVQSAAFIRSVAPKKNLLNSYAFGGYLVAELPEYPVSLDGRGPFGEFLREMKEAKADPERYALFLRKYSINVVLEEIPGTMMSPGGGLKDSHENLYPADEWALVFFDNTSVVYLRRIPEHQELMSRFGYYFIKRGLPAGFGAEMAGLSESTRQGFEAEFDRCLERMANNTYCLVGKSAFLRGRGDVSTARNYLLRAESSNPRNAEMLMALAGFYESTGEHRLARDATRRFESLTTQL